jgi:hypothetical protein
MAARKDQKTKAAPRRTASTRHSRQCGLCGNTRKLTRTECCGEWICNDEDNYVLFSYARNSCSRNHRCHTLCGYHYTEEHEGNWKDCTKCRNEIETEMYVWYGTNDHNFEKLENSPTYEPTKCDKCGSVIVLGEDVYSTQGDEYFCERCSSQMFSGI